MPRGIWFRSPRLFEKWKGNKVVKEGLTIQDVLNAHDDIHGVSCDGRITGLQWSTSEAGDPTGTFAISFETLGGSSYIVGRGCVRGDIIFQILIDTLTSASPSRSASPSSSASASVSPSASISPSTSVSPSISPSASFSPSSSASLSVSPSGSVSPSSSSSNSESFSPSPSSSVSPSIG